MISDYTLQLGPGNQYLQNGIYGTKMCTGQALQMKMAALNDQETQEYVAVNDLNITPNLSTVCVNKSLSGSLIETGKRRARQVSVSVR